MNELSEAERLRRELMTLIDTKFDLRDRALELAHENLKSQTATRLTLVGLGLTILTVVLRFLLK